MGPLSSTWRAGWTSTNSAGSHVPCSWLGSVPSKVLSFRKHQFQSGPQGENRPDCPNFRPSLYILKIYSLILKVDISKASCIIYMYPNWISKAVKATTWKKITVTHQETERKTIAALLTPRSTQGTRSRKLQFTQFLSHQGSPVERTEDPQWCFSILLKLIPFENCCPFHCRLFGTPSWSLFLRMDAFQWTRIFVHGSKDPSANHLHVQCTKLKVKKQGAHKSKHISISGA